MSAGKGFEPTASGPAMAGPTRILSLSLLVACLLGGSGSAAELHIVFEGNRVSIDAQQVLLSDLLARLANRQGLDIRISPEVDRPVTFTVHDISLEKALALLAEQEHLNLILGWRHTARHERFLSLIQVLPVDNADLFTAREQNAVGTAP